jgi:addiction module HigA family antidote
MKKITPIHAGEILLEEFMQPYELSQNALAKALHVTPRRTNEIVNKKRAITADTALRLAKFFGNSAEFWMNLQNRYDLETARDALSVKINDEVELYHAS